MIRHVILWQLKDELSEADKQSLKKEIKARLEALQGQVPGLLKVEVCIDPLPSSNTDIFLDSVVENEQALEVYQNFPAHVAIKQDLVGPNAKMRLCMDFQQ